MSMRASLRVVALLRPDWRVPRRAQHRGETGKVFETENGKGRGEVPAVNKPRKLSSEGTESVTNKSSLLLGKEA